MKPLALGILALALACGNAQSSERAASPNADTQSRTTTTGATTKQGTTSTGYSQSTVGHGMSGAGADRAVETPSKVTPPMTFGPKTGAPAPINTGDPCTSCPERR